MEMNSSLFTNSDEFTNHIHPELRNVLSALPETLITSDMITVAREQGNAMVEQMLGNLPKNENVRITQQMIPGIKNNPKVSITLYKPEGLEDKRPAILSIHGGGMVSGNVRSEEPNNVRLADQLKVTVVSVEYRLAPENPFPAGLNDCYAALLWLADQTDTLAVDRDRIYVNGGSAGAGLAAAVAIKARDEDGPKISAQFLSCPMLDYRNNSASSHEITDHRVWSREQNILAWEMYLGNMKKEAITALASPALLDDFSNLPSTFLTIGSMDIFRDECIVYAQNLLQAGIDAELHVFPGVFHGAEGFVPNAGIVQRMESIRTQALSNFIETGHF